VDRLRELLGEQMDKKGLAKKEVKKGKKGKDEGRRTGQEGEFIRKGEGNQRHIFEEKGGKPMKLKRECI
jgi:hypothetical protein